VTRLRRDGRPGGPFLAELEDGTEVEARRVVLASGIESHRRLPECLRRLPPGRVAHSWDVGAYEGTTGKRLLVVGGGQSAAEVLAHVANANQVTWVHRSGLIFFAEPINLPRPLFALVLRVSAGMFFLPTRLRRLLGRIFVASTITPDLKPAVLDSAIRRLHADVAELGLEERPGGLFSPALDAHFDSVIACTGYRYSLETLGYLDPALHKQIETTAPGVPRLGYDFATSVPGLYMIGGMAEPTHGPAQRFMMGCRTATLRVSRALGR
jgi:thioredoxin reductase